LDGTTENSKSLAAPVNIIYIML